MTVKSAQSHYALHATLLLLAALLLATQPFAAALSFAPLNWLGGILDQRAFESPFYLGIAGGLLLLAAIAVYVRNLNPNFTRRRRGLVYLNFFAPSFFAGAALLAYGWGIAGGPPDVSFLVLAPVAALVPPLFVVLIELFLVWALQKLGATAQQQQWRGMAARALSASLRLDPGNRATIRTTGLLLVEEDDFAAGAAMLERLGPVENSDDADVVRARESAYRSLGRYSEALDCLLRLRKLQPKTPGLDRRILDEFLRLERYQEALDLVESGVFREDSDILRMRQDLNVKLGNVAQAMEQIRRIAEHEQPPFVQSVKLYRELLEQLPDQIEIKINLGQLLLKDAADVRRHEGARLLEEAAAQEPKRLHISRTLAYYYRDAGQADKMREHELRLVKAGDTDAEIYLQYAQHMRDEGRIPDALAVLDRMNKIIPDDWRGHNRLARLLLEIDRLDDALKHYLLAREKAPQSEEQTLDRLERDILRRQREKELLAQSGGGEVAQGLQEKLVLIGDMIRMEWTDKAILQCEALLDENPEALPQVQMLLEKAISQIQQNYRVCDYLGDLYLVEGRYSDALRLYHVMSERSLNPNQTLIEGCRKVLARAPQNVEARRELALVYREASDWPTIVATLDPVMNGSGNGGGGGGSNSGSGLDPADKALWVEATFRSGKAEEAARVGLTLVEDLKGEPGYMIMLIDILVELGLYDQAYEVLMRAKHANPGDARIVTVERRVVGDRKKHRLSVLQRRGQEGKLTSQEHYELGELYHDKGELQKSIVEFQHAAANEDRPIMAVARLAEVLCERGMLDLANETLDPLDLTRELAQEYPQLKAILYRVAETLEKGRRFAQALKFYKRIFFVDASYADVVERVEKLSQ